MELRTRYKLLLSIYNGERCADLSVVYNRKTNVNKCDAGLQDEQLLETTSLFDMPLMLRMLFSLDKTLIDSESGLKIQR